MHHAFQIIFHRKIFMGIISSACLLNPVLILTVVTQRMSTIYLKFSRFQPLLDLNKHFIIVH